MAAFNHFHVFTRDIAAGVHNFATGTSHVFKAMLTNTLPLVTNAVKADIAEIAAGNGYVAGGGVCTFTSGAQTSGVFKCIVADPATWTATPASMAAFQWAVLYNDTPASPLKPLIGWWAYPSTVNLLLNETFQVDLDQVNGIFTLTVV